MHFYLPFYSTFYLINSAYFTHLTKFYKSASFAGVQIFRNQDPKVVQNSRVMAGQDFHVQIQEEVEGPAMVDQEPQVDVENPLGLPRHAREANRRAYHSLCVSARGLIIELVSVDLERCEKAVERAASKRQWRTIRASVVFQLKDLITELTDTGSEMTYEEVSKKARSWKV